MDERMTGEDPRAAGTSRTGDEPADLRSDDLCRRLCERLDLDQQLASDALTALIGIVHPRLGRGLQACLVSWMPGSCVPASVPGRGADHQALRGQSAITAALAHAGLPAEMAPSFVATWLDFLESRCGRPLGEAVRRRVPELARMAAERPLAQPADEAPSPAGDTPRP